MSPTSASASDLSQARSNFLGLAQVLADNFEASSDLKVPAAAGGDARAAGDPTLTLKKEPGRQVIVVLGSSASDNPPLPDWSVDLKHKILEKVNSIFSDETTFLNEICRVFSDQLGYLLHRSSEGKRAAILKLRVEQISNVACQMLGPADVMVRQLISDEYRVMTNPEVGPPPHLTYELLAHLIKHGFVNHVVTMNFDEMLDTALENELGAGGFNRIITGHESIDTIEANIPKLFKVHGTSSSPESLRFTYNDVSMLTPAQAKNLDALLAAATAPDCGCLDLLSFGYSWQDADLAHWVLANRERFHSIFIVRRRQNLPAIFAKQSKKRFKIISMDDLCGGRGQSVSSSLFWWCLVEQTCDLLARRPLIPFSRHLLLGNLLTPTSSTPVSALERRLRLELLLHLLKSKGMINTFGTSESPRIRSYFSRLRKVQQDQFTVDTFLRDLRLDGFMKVSPEPEASDTYFSTANSVDELIDDVSGSLAQEMPLKIKQPLLGAKTLSSDEVDRSDFVRKQAREIVLAPEIEIVREASPRLQFVFAHPIQILSFPQFVRSIQEILSPPWTHLLAIVESKRWLDYPWTRDLLAPGKARTILMILPSLDGLKGWHVGRVLREAEHAIKIDDELRELEIPWWRHNRHMFLPIQCECDDGTARLGDGVFFFRKHKAPAVAPALLREPQDRARLLATFMNYSQRSTPGGRDLRQVLKKLVESLIRGGAIDPAKLDLVKKALTALASLPE
jgi:hypothetical protein